VGYRNLPGRITFISHAPTAATRAAAFPFDEPVEPPRLVELRALGRRPVRAQQIEAAPELRARQTASALGLDPLPCPDLRELDFGVWSGRPPQEIEPGGLAQWLSDTAATPHGGESIDALLLRVEGWLTARRDTGHTIAITHPSVIRAAILHTLQAPAQSFWRIDIPPASVTDLRWNGRAWTLRSSGGPIATGVEPKSVLIH